MSMGGEFAAQLKNFFVQSEYERFAVDRFGAKPHFNGFYVEGGWMITGEARKYNTQTAAFDGPRSRIRSRYMVAVLAPSSLLRAIRSPI